MRDAPRTSVLDGGLRNVPAGAVRCGRDMRALRSATTAARRVLCSARQATPAESGRVRDPTHPALVRLLRRFASWPIGSRRRRRDGASLFFLRGQLVPCGVPSVVRCRSAAWRDGTSLDGVWQFKTRVVRPGVARARWRRSRYIVQRTCAAVGGGTRARVGRRSSRRRGWELIAHCLEHFSPSQALERHFVQFVSGANPSLLPLLLMNLEDQDGLI